MADVKWIKITTDMFDNRKIKHLRRLPDGNNVVLIWVMLLTMAGRCNSNGMIFLTENIPYTPKMLADELDFEENTVLLALKALEELNMIVTDSGFFKVAGWEEYQNVEGMDKIRTQTRQRVARHREKQKLLECNVTCNATVTHCNATEEDIDIDKDIDNITNTNVLVRQTEAVRRVVDEWNSLSQYGIKNISKLSNGSKRYQSLVARINEYSADDVLKAIDNIRHSNFLQGKVQGKRQWVITFDWFVLPNNFPKVLEGQYNDNGKDETAYESESSVRLW